MKSWTLLVFTAATMLLTGFVLHWAGWFSHRAHHRTSTIRAASRDTPPSAMALRQVRTQTTHWRDCLLAR